MTTRCGEDDGTLVPYEQAQRERIDALGRLAASMAHETNTALLAIRGLVELLADNDVSLAERADYRGLAHHEVDRIASHISAVLDLYRPELPDRGPADPLRIIHAIMRVMAGDFQRRGITVRLVAAREASLVALPRELMRRILLELFDCALVANDGEVVTLEVRDDQEEYVIRMDLRGPLAPEASMGHFAICQRLLQPYAARLEADYHDHRASYRLHLPLYRAETL